MLFRYLAKYRQMNSVFKALADPTRRKVLELLRQRPMTAGELSDHFPVSRPTMSAHFAVLREADLIEANKIGNRERLVFHRYGDQYFLSQVWFAGDEDGHEFIAGAQEKKASTNRSTGDQVVAGQ